MTTPSRRLIRELPLSQQPATRLERDGVAALSLVELLALLLQTPDALDLAQELMAHIGPEHLPFVTETELQHVRGIGPTRAKQILAALELGRRLLNHSEARQHVRSPADAVAILMPLLAKREEERLVVLLLDTKNYVLDTVQLYKGNLNSNLVRIGEVFRDAVRRQAASVIVAHNHPSGDPSPSPEDVRVTRELHQAGKLLDIELLDHLILGDGRFISLKERGLGFA